MPGHTKISLRASTGTSGEHEALRRSLVYIRGTFPRSETDSVRVGFDDDIPAHFVALVVQKKCVPFGMGNSPRGNHFVRLGFRQTSDLAQTCCRASRVVGARRCISARLSRFDCLPNCGGRRQQGDHGRNPASHIGHLSSLTGHGANLDNAPTATTEAATSVVGDIVRDGTDPTPGRHRSPVEKSDATGAAAPSRRPHRNPSTESGSVQR